MMLVKKSALVRREPLGFKMISIAAFLVFVADLISIFSGTSHSLFTVRVIGAVMSVAETIVFMVAVQTMRDSWRAGVSQTDKTELVTSGRRIFACHVWK